MSRIELCTVARTQTRTLRQLADLMNDPKHPNTIFGIAHRFEDHRCYPCQMLQRVESLAACDRRGDWEFHSISDSRIVACQIIRSASENQRVALHTARLRLVLASA